MHDLVIKNTVIYDGSGEAPQHAALAVSEGRIAEIGSDVGAGREVVDAEGLALAPGIIDTHTHYDAQVTWDPWLDPSSRLGVTTVVMGNCGFTVAPCKPQHRAATARNLCNVEGMSIEALREGMRWEFESFGNYLDHLESRGVGLNVACFAGHSSIRTWVMGDDATERAATADEIAAMADLVREAMAAGAIGFATSTFEGHNGAGGVPMPSRLAKQDELQALVVAMAEGDRGTFMLTRGSGSRLSFLESLAEMARRPVIVAALLHNPLNDQTTTRAMQKIAEANSRGHELYGQVSCCPLTLDFTLYNPYMMEAFDSWKPIMEAEPEDLPRLYRDPELRAAVKAEIAEPGKITAFTGDWSGIKVAEVANPANRDKEGRDTADLAAEAGVDPLDWILDFGLSEDMKTTFASVLLNADSEAVGKLLSDPYSTIALSDAGAHLTFFCDAGFGLNLYGSWVRERGLFSLERAIYEMTGRQADIYRIRGRGRLRPGAWADMMLFDPTTVARSPNLRVHDLPAGASRLVYDAKGLHGVWVNGSHIADAGGLITNGALPGMVIRKFDS